MSSSAISVDHIGGFGPRPRIGAHSISTVTRWAISLALVLVATPPAFSQNRATTASIIDRSSRSVVFIKGSTPSGDVFGSGFIVSADGKVATNLHVIREMTSGSVELSSGEVFDGFTILSLDERKDIAIVKIPGFDLPVIELGNSNDVKRGEPVVVIGSPKGLKGTVTTGIVSAVRDDPFSGTFKVIQTDASVDPGNSGGPLLNSTGKIIGVVVSKLRDAEQLNFAVPINYVRGLLADTTTTPIKLAELHTKLETGDAPPPNGLRTTATDGVMEEVSQAQMRSILKEMGVEFTEKDYDGTNTFSFKLEGVNVRLFSQVKSMELWTAFTDKIDLSKINEWNKNNRFGRAYQNEEGGPSLEDDLSFAGGTTKPAIKAFIKQFGTTLTSYVDFLSNVTPKGDPVTRSTVPSFTRPAASKQRVTTPGGDFTVWFDETKWKQQKSDKPGTMSFSHVNGEAWAQIISERIGIPLDTLRQVALEKR